MEQLSFFSMSESDACSMLFPSLKKIVSDNWLPEDRLKVNENKDYYSITYGPYVVAQLHEGSKPWFSIPRALNENFRNKYPVSDLSEILHYEYALCEALQCILDAIPSDYSCCSRYAECSNAKRCTCPDKDFAVGCSYRKTLKSGKVFFGINRNVD